MMQTIIYSPENQPNNLQRKDLIEFLFTHLEQYGDRKEDIEKCLLYAITSKNGGMIVAMLEQNELVGASIVNRTGMKGYIPENILVYIATHNQHRGKGIGSRLMQSVIEHTEGNLALHVEPDNPAKTLYEKCGFTNKYLEMRLDKNKMTQKKEEKHGAYNA